MIKPQLPVILLYLCILFSVNSCTAPERSASRPNIILIMADDLGYGGIGCYGNTEIQTPNLDALAAEGLRFTDFHANAPVCSPTRAALLTGRYQQRSGLEGVIYVRGETRQTGLDTSETTLAEVLKQEGYATGIMGKWHLGYEERYNPVHHGFDTFYGFRSGNIDYHSHYDNAGIYDWYHNTDTLHEEGYSTDLITKHSIDFIEKNKDRPFFLYIPHEAPHVPFQGRNDTAYRFPGREFSYYGPVEDRHRAYREMVEAMDEGIGAVRQKLEQLDLLENTLIFFLSDNGALAEYGDNGALNGAKTNLYEGGHRVPAIAYWPGKIDPGVSGEVLMSFDLFPTLLSVCGIDISSPSALDGADFSPVLFDRQDMPGRDLFWRYRNQKAARSGDYKLLVTKTDTLLFNLASDPAEKENLARENADLQQELLDKLKAWEREMSRYGLRTD